MCALYHSHSGLCPPDLCPPDGAESRNSLGQNQGLVVGETLNHGLIVIWNKQQSHPLKVSSLEMCTACEEAHLSTKINILTIQPTVFLLKLLFVRTHQNIIHIFLHSTYAYMHTDTHIHARLHIYTHIHACLHIYTHIMHAYTYTHT